MDEEFVDVQVNITPETMNQIMELALHQYVVQPASKSLFYELCVTVGYEAALLRAIVNDMVHKSLEDAVERYDPAQQQLQYDQE